MALLRHGGQGDWREPDTTKYMNEAALQQLLAESPGLLYGVEKDSALVARELFILGTGYLDLAIVHLDGAITLVECKLSSNPEIRREIVGQILAYAAAISRWGVDDLAAAWRSTTKTDLDESALALATESSVPFEPTNFRYQLAANLAAGRFRLILAVDQATSELRNIVEFLNRRSTDDLEVLGVEFEYIRDGDVEILIPNTFGIESAERKSSTRIQHTEQEFLTALTSTCSDRVVVAVEHLLEHARHMPQFESTFWGEGAAPSVTVKLSTPNGPIHPWSFYTATTGKAVLGINFDWIHRRGKGIPDVGMAAFRDSISGLPGVAPLIATVQDDAWARRRSIPAEALFADPTAVKTLEIAIEHLMNAGGD